MHVPALHSWLKVTAFVLQWLRQLPQSLLPQQAPTLECRALSMVIAHTCCVQLPFHRLQRG